MVAYPVALTALENGDVMAVFPDLPEAVTCGATAAIALEWAQDALQVALAGYMDDQGVSQVRFAGLLHCDARQVRRLLDLDHQSILAQIMDAADILGFRLDFDLRPKADPLRPAAQDASPPCPA